MSKSKKEKGGESQSRNQKEDHDMYKQFYAENSLNNFLEKTFKLINESKNKGFIDWNKDGKSFVIKNTARFAENILPKYFKHNNLSSFIRQLNMYGFHKVKQEKQLQIYEHPYFQRDNMGLLVKIQRKLPYKQSSKEEQAQSRVNEETSKDELIQSQEYSDSNQQREEMQSQMVTTAESNETQVKGQSGQGPITKEQKEANTKQIKDMIVALENRIKFLEGHNSNFLDRNNQLQNEIHFQKERDYALEKLLMLCLAILLQMNGMDNFSGFNNREGFSFNNIGLLKYEKIDQMENGSKDTRQGNNNNNINGDRDLVFGIEALVSEFFSQSQKQEFSQYRSLLNKSNKFDFLEAFGHLFTHAFCDQNKRDYRESEKNQISRGQQFSKTPTVKDMIESQLQNLYKENGTSFNQFGRPVGTQLYSRKDLNQDKFAFMSNILNSQEHEFIQEKAQQLNITLSKENKKKNSKEELKEEIKKEENFDQHKHSMNSLLFNNQRDYYEKVIEQFSVQQVNAQPLNDFSTSINGMIGKRKHRHFQGNDQKLQQQDIIQSDIEYDGLKSQDIN